MLRADVVCRGQRERRTIEERGVVLSVIVGVAAQDIEHDPAKEFPQCLVSVSEPGSDLVCQISVARIAASRILQEIFKKKL